MGLLARYDALQTRADAADCPPRTGANRRLSGTLASTAKELEKSMTSDKIDRHLTSRPDAEELEKSNVMQSSSVAPQLQGVQRQLQRKMSADELSHRLDSRPDVQELRDHGIVLNGACGALVVPILS